MLQKIRKGRGWEAQCDLCDDDLQMPDANSFEDALADIKLSGWKPVSVNGVWEHRCPACLEEEESKK